MAQTLAHTTLGPGHRLPCLGLGLSFRFGFETGAAATWQLETLHGNAGK